MESSMFSLLTLGLVGAGVVATSTLLQSMTAKSADGVPRLGTQDARPILAGLGLIGTLLLPGIGSVLAAAMGAGAVLNMMMPSQPTMLSGVDYFGHSSA